MGFLHLFSGEKGLPEGWAQLLRDRGARCKEVDYEDGRCPADNLQLDGLFEELGDDCDTWVDHMHAGIPCETWSVRPGQPKRSHDEPEGLASLPPAHRAQVDVANDLCERACELAARVAVRGRTFSLEGPAYRGDDKLSFYWEALAHFVSLRQMPCVIALQLATGAVWIYEPHCAFGALAQKWTMWLVSPSLLPWLTRITRARCCGRSPHPIVLGGNDAAGERIAKKFASYPLRLVEVWVEACWGAHAREVVGGEGEIQYWPGLHPAVDRAVREARRAAPGYASFHHLRGVPSAERVLVPMPPQADLEPAPPSELTRTRWERGIVEAGPDDESVLDDAGGMRPARPRAERIPGSPALRIAYWMMFTPQAGGRREGMERMIRYRDAAARAMVAVALGEPFQAPDTVVIPRELKEPWARDVLVDSRNPRDCVRTRISTRWTVVPGRQLDREAYRDMVDEIGWREVDPDGVEQFGEGGVEDRTTCGFYTVLSWHHTGVVEHFDDADEVITDEVDEGWVFGPFDEAPPLEPIRVLPRNVIQTLKQSAGEDGGIITKIKSRISTNSSMESVRGQGDDPNSNVSMAEKTMRLPRNRRHGTAAGVVDAFSTGAEGVRAETYSVDGEKAFRFLIRQRLEWWLCCFTWGLRSGGGTQPPRTFNGGWHRRRFAQAAGRKVGWFIDTRTHFGGTHAPNRYGRFARSKRAACVKDIRAFEAAHPYPAGVQAAVEARQAAQARGALPLGREQCEPHDLQSFIDDDGGSALNDVTGIPPELASVELDLSCMRVHDGRPTDLASRCANHCRLVIKRSESLGLAVSRKTQAGDGVVSIGLRIDVQADKLDCPPVKGTVLLTDLTRARSLFEQDRRVELRPTRKTMGRLGALAEIWPELLPIMHPGYAVAGVTKVARARRRRGEKEADVQLRSGSRSAIGFGKLLVEAEAIVRENRGIPLLAEADFPGEGSEGVLTMHTDASRAAVDDGWGGWGTHADVDGVIFAMTAGWATYPRIRQALHRAAERLRVRSGGPTFSMPAAELAAMWLLAGAVAAWGAPIKAVIAVGDCQPAAAALNKAKGKSAVMRASLSHMLKITEQWLGVWIPREINTDADRCSHPTMAAEVEAAVAAAGARLVWLQPRVEDMDALLRHIEEGSGGEGTPVH